MKASIYFDFDAFVDSVRDVDSRMLVRNVKQQRWSTTSLSVGGLHIQIGKLGSGNIAEGQSYSNGYIVYLPMSDRTEYMANGCVLDGTKFAILEPGCEFSIATADKHDWCAAFLPTKYFNPSDLTSRTRRTCRVTRAMPARARAFRTLIENYVQAVTRFPKIESSPASAFAASELQELTKTIVCEPRPKVAPSIGRRRIPRDEVIRRSRKEIERQTGRPVQIPDLAEGLGVSERTLRNAFYEYYGVGPNGYLQLKQLNDVHRDLKRANPDNTRVGDVLGRNGVWEFGRFAVRYRRLFGKLPSETLRNMS